MGIIKTNQYAGAKLGHNGTSIAWDSRQQYVFSCLLCDAHFPICTGVLSLLRVIMSDLNK